MIVFVTAKRLLNVFCEHARMIKFRKTCSLPNTGVGSLYLTENDQIRERTIFFGNFVEMTIFFGNFVRVF